MYRLTASNGQLLRSWLEVIVEYLLSGAVEARAKGAFAPLGGPKQRCVHRPPGRTCTQTGQTQTARRQQGRCKPRGYSLHNPRTVFAEMWYSAEKRSTILV
jgi:hypothetical protein